MGHGSGIPRIALVLTIGAGVADVALLPFASASGQSASRAGIYAATRADGAAGAPRAQGAPARAANRHEAVETTPQAKANKVAAIRDARAHLSDLKLPKGARRSQGAPAEALSGECRTRSRGCDTLVREFRAQAVEE